MTLVKLDRAGAIATLTLDRPDARNAMSAELIEDLNGAIDRLEQDEDHRVVVIAGAGRSFCAGMDLKAVRHDPAAMGVMLRRLSVATRRLRRLPVPVIAAVQGAAIGGGCGLMVVADFAVTHPEAKLGYPEVDLGVCPAVVAPWLIRRIGAGPARAMLLAGGTMTGEEGHARGLSTHLVAREEIAGTVETLAAHLGRGGPRALAATKRWLNELDGSTDDAVLDRAAEISAEIIAGEEAQTRLAAVFDRV